MYVTDVTTPIYSQPCSIDPKSGVSGGQMAPRDHTDSKFTMSEEEECLTGRYPTIV